MRKYCIEFQFLLFVVRVEVESNFGNFINILKIQICQVEEKFYSLVLTISFDFYWNFHRLYATFPPICTKKGGEKKEGKDNFEQQNMPKNSYIIIYFSATYLYFHAKILLKLFDAKLYNINFHRVDTFRHSWKVDFSNFATKILHNAGSRWYGK